VDIEPAAPFDTSDLDVSRLGPKGETPWVQPAAPTFRGLIDITGDYDDVSDVIGAYRELTPCPRSGRINFKQVGGLRLKTSEIEMDDEDLLVCRKPEATGELGGNNAAIYRHKEPTNDPSDYYQAVWGHAYDVYRAPVLPMNPLNGWNEGFSAPYPTENDQENGYGLRGVQIGEEDGQKHFRLYSGSYSERVFLGWYPDGRPAYGDRYYPRATYCNAYVGRFEPGTRLVLSFEANNTFGGWESEEGAYQIAAWSEGWFGGEQKIYKQGAVATRGSWDVFTTEITIDDRFRDLWLAFQQNGSGDTSQFQSTYFRNYQIWRA